MVCTQPFLPASFQAPQPLADALLRPDQMHGVYERVGHGRRRLGLLAVEEQVLDPHGRLLVAEALREVVVEVLARAPMPPM